jgi:hypothetical protein
MPRTILEIQFHCCGNSGCGDYRQLNMDLPRSCDIDCEVGWPVVGGCKLHNAGLPLSTVPEPVRRRHSAHSRVRARAARSGSVAE